MQPTQLGRYRILRPLGRGGMGVVYEAHDPRIDRPVAIKTIALSGLDARETAVFEARFEAEMRFAGRLQHQNIAALYDTGREGDTAYIVMELVPGQDLKRLLAAGRRFEPAEAIGIVGQLLAALDYAHRRQVIHRDVKPANVMLQDDGLVKLCDFGVARPADAEATRTQGVMVGSLHYASPEQIAGLPIDIRTDIFSTGALLFELLTGERPFKGASEAEVLNRVANAETPSCRSLAPQVPPEVDAAIQRALAKRPADRFASADAFAQALGVPLFAGGATGNLPPRPAPPADVTVATGPPLAARMRPMVWVGAGLVAGSAVWWAVVGRAPAGPARAPGEPLRVAGSASAAAPQAASGGRMPPTASPPTTPSALRPSVQAPAPAPAPAHAERPAAGPPLPKASGARPASPPPPPAAHRPAQGTWQARATCGPVQASAAAKGQEAFSTVFAIEVDWPRLSWRRDTPFVTASVAGSFDEAARFQAQGQGARKDRAEAWLERAEGSYVHASRSLVGRTWLLRPKDNSVARECQLVATVGAPPPAPSAEASPQATPGGTTRAAVARGATTSTAPTLTAPARTAAAASADRLAADLPQGDWDGELFCTAAAGPEASAPAGRPFTTPAVVTVDGNRVRITREGAAISESSEGRIDAGHRFTAAGTGRYKLRRSSWTVQVQGEFLRQPARLQGRVQLLRSDDGSLARECSLRARPRL